MGISLLQIGISFEVDIDQLVHDAAVATLRQYIKLEDGDNGDGGGICDDDLGDIYTDEDDLTLGLLGEPNDVATQLKLQVTQAVADLGVEPPAFKVWVTARFVE